DRMLLRKPREERLLRSLAIFLAHRELVGRPRTENAEIFGQDDELCAFPGRPRDQRFGLLEVRANIASRDHLHRCDTHRLRGVRHRVMPIVASPAGTCGAALAVAAALRATIGSDQLPVTAYS